VEILKALSHEPRVLILDEPTSSLTSIETDLLFRNIRRLKSLGVGIIYISHHLPEVFEIADRVTVLRDGRRVDTLAIRDVTEVDLVRRMVGRDLDDVYGRERATPGEAYFSVDGATGQRFRDVSFSLRRGEILGMAGLVGSGRTEVARALFGAERLQSGRVRLNGQELHIRSVPQAIRSGLGYLTESRKQDGLFINMSIRENCIAPALDSFTNRWGFLRQAQIEEFAEASRQAFHVVTPGAGQLVRNLSGGNQQKVLLSMWMGIQPRVLIVDEPTRGVDVGARSEIYALLRRLAGAGVGIILISSDLPEVLGMSDRVLVMREGRVAGEFLANEATEENVIACATGVKA
jgi:ABC-type sugar transport system ATPase subunit